MNRLFLLLFGMVTFVAHAQVPDYVPTEGLVAWYPFNGNANDESGNGYNGVVHGAFPSENRFGIASKSFSFDGIDDFISVSNDFNFNELTVSVWIKQNQIAETYSTIIDRSLTNNIGWWIEDNSVSYDSLLFTGGVASGNYFRTQAERPQLNVWTHIGARYSPGNQELYINGVLVDHDLNNAMLQFPDVMMYIGKRTNSAFWNGVIDDVALWNRALSEEEILALYNAPAPAPGCTDTTACNFNEEATWNDDTCEYGCLNCGPGTVWNDSLSLCLPSASICGEGTIWDASIQACVGFNDCPSDLDGDGLIGVEDLLSLLSDFGTDCVASDDPESAEWTCGDPVSYHSYDYATVQIGEQCWFAENLRTELYQNGDSIQGELADEEWAATAEGAYSIYGEGETSCSENSPDGDACDATWSYEVYGCLYNWYATIDNRNICPSGWHVPHEFQWTTLESYLEVDIAEKIKTPSGWQNGNNGTNTSGFSALPNGWRGVLGYFTQAGGRGLWWTVNIHSSYQGRYVHLLANSESILHSYTNNHDGLAVRCLKDAE